MTSRSSMVAAIFLALGMTGPAGAQQTAEFELTVDITWSAATAPYEFPPDGGHMSSLIGATHNARYVLFRDGDTASSGLELVAENGRAATLKAEFAEARRRGRLGTEINGPKLDKVPGQISVRFEASEKHSRLSFVTMIAPSPDWFTGATDIALRVDGNWINTTSITLWAWDSGTDHGMTYNAEDMDAQPQQSIRLLASPHFLTGRGLVPMGTATVTRVGL
ncbi:MAG: hypothetical protein HKN11_14525 [Rhizobiales bacterium]|nr:hypothetical protein [Hyphomicrobiales bacterium]